MFYTWKEVSENGNHKAALNNEREMLKSFQNQNSLNRETVSGNNITFEFLRATNKQINKHHINSKTDNNSNLLRVLLHFATIWLGRSTMFEFSFYKFVLLQEQTILVRLWNFDEHFFMFPVLSICLFLVSYLFGRKSFKSCSRGNPPLQALLNWGVMVGNIGVIYLENWSPAGNVSPANYRKNPFNQWWWSGKRQTKNVAGKFTFYQLQEEMHKHQINIERTFFQSPHAF